MEERQQGDDQPLDPDGASEDEEDAGSIPLREPPPEDPDGLVDRRLMQGNPPLAVRFYGFAIERTGAPGRIAGRLIELVSNIVRDLSNGEAMLEGAVVGNSMTLYFADPSRDPDQMELDVEQTLDAAVQVSELIVATDEELFQRAVRIGPSVKNYVELARFVEKEAITIDWRPRDHESRTLDSERAGEQRRRLEVEPEFTQHQATVHGVLYRVITEPPATVGTVGIQLFKQSAELPTIRRGGKVKAIHFDGAHLQSQIRSGLLGEAVVARLDVHQPRAGAAINIKRVEFHLLDIQPLDVENWLGIPLERLLAQLPEGEDASEDL